MKSKFMRMVGRGVEDPEEEEPQVFQEYEEEEPIQEEQTFQEYQDETRLENKKDEALPLISDGEIDALYNKFKELGYQSDFTDKREYVLDAYIKMENFLSFSFPGSLDTLEGSGLLSDLLSEQKYLINDVTTLQNKIKTLKKENNETQSEFDLRKQNIQDELNDKQALLNKKNADIEVAKEQDVMPEEDYINNIYKLKKSINNLEHIGLSPEEKKFKKGPLEVEIENNMKKLTRPVEEGGLGLSETTVKFLVPLLSDSIPYDKRPKQVVINTNLNEFIINRVDVSGNEEKAIVVNPMFFKDEYKNVTSARVLKIIKSFVTVQDMRKFEKDLLIAFQNKADEIEGESTTMKKEANEIKKILILTSLQYPLVGYFKLDDNGNLKGDDKIIQEAFKQRASFQGVVHSRIPKMVRKFQDIIYLNALFTENYASKMYSNKIATYIFSKVINSPTFINKIDDDDLYDQIMKHFEKNLNTMELYYSSVFSDIDKIDNVIDIKLKNNQIVKLYLETKSSEVSSNKGLGGVYTGEKKFFNLIVSALIQKVNFVFHDFYLVRDNYAPSIVSGASRDLKPKKSFIVELFSLYKDRGFTFDYSAKMTKETKDSPSRQSVNQHGDLQWNLHIIHTHNIFKAGKDEKTGKQLFTNEKIISISEAKELFSILNYKGSQLLKDPTKQSADGKTIKNLLIEGDVFMVERLKDEYYLDLDKNLSETPYKTPVKKSSILKPSTSEEITRGINILNKDSVTKQIDFTQVTKKPISPSLNVSMNVLRTFGNDLLKLGFKEIFDKYFEIINNTIVLKSEFSPLKDAVFFNKLKNELSSSIKQTPPPPPPSSTKKETKDTKVHSFKLNTGETIKKLKPERLNLFLTRFKMNAPEKEYKKYVLYNKLIPEKEPEFYENLTDLLTKYDYVETDKGKLRYNADTRTYDILEKKK